MLETATEDLDPSGDDDVNSDEHDDVDAVVFPDREKLINCWISVQADVVVDLFLLWQEEARIIQWTGLRAKESLLGFLTAATFLYPFELTAKLKNLTDSRSYLP